MDDPALRALREALAGVTPEAAVFEDAMQQKLTEQPIEPSMFNQSDYAQQNAAKASAMLAEHGLAYPPQAVPPARKLQGLQESDWTNINESQTPLLSLWSRTNAHETVRFYANRKPEGYKPPQDLQAEEALLKSLPLIHGTSYQALCAAFEGGAFVSNRALFDEKNIDVTGGGVGATNGMDRDVGLDNYVFADYARPHSFRRGKSEVEVVLEPEAMQQPGAFVTQHDLQDFDMFTPDGRSDFRKYMGEAFTVDDFGKIVSANIKRKQSERVSWGGRHTGEIRHKMTLEDFAGGSDAEFDQTGIAHFSTYEVKMPQVPVEHTRKVIFSDPAQYDAFRQRFPNISCEMRPKSTGVVEDRLSAGYAQNMELYGTSERQQRELQRMRSETYAERVAGLREAEDVQEGYMILLHPAPHDADANTYNPNWFAANQVKYTSPEEALAVARRSREADPLAVIMNEVHPEAKMGTAQTAAIAKVSYSGANNDLTTIQNLTVEPVI